MNEENDKATVIIKIAPEDKQALIRIAEANERNMTQQIVHLIRRESRNLDRRANG